jgi:hypothetical protein
MTESLLSSWAFYFRETLLGSVAQFFIDLNAELEIW